MLEKIEKLSEKSNNILVLYYIMRLLDLVLKNKLITIDDKETGSLVYLINNIFLIHDILIGSSIAKRMVQRSRSLLLYILKRSKLNGVK